MPQIGDLDLWPSDLSVGRANQGACTCEFKALSWKTSMLWSRFKFCDRQINRKQNSNPIYHRKGTKNVRIIIYKFYWWLHTMLPSQVHMLKLKFTKTYNHLKSNMVHIHRIRTTVIPNIIMTINKIQMYYRITEYLYKKVIIKLQCIKHKVATC